MLEIEYKIIDISFLLPHEEVDFKEVESLGKIIFNDGVVFRPIIVDRNTGVIIDGHHRYNVLKLMGFKQVPVFFVDYLKDSRIILNFWRDNFSNLSKQDILNFALKGEKFPVKTSRHSFDFNLEQKTNLLELV